MCILSGISCEFTVAAAIAYDDETRRRCSQEGQAIDQTRSDVRLFLRVISHPCVVHSKKKNVEKVPQV